MGGGSAGRLARRLVDRGLAHPRPPLAAPPSVTVVVPVRDRPEGLRRTLAALGPDLPVVVVDDGSSDPAAVREAAPGATVVRRCHPGGPAAARNEGWSGVGTDLVAFVDADVEVGGRDLQRLARHLGDPAVAAVAPRIASVAEPGTPAWLAAYDRGRSPLDMGSRPAPVRPGGAVSYVPTTVLVVRRAAVAAAGGFDEHLRTGEDVDLVWRLVAAGWSVRFDPSVTASHPTRSHLRGWLGQRFGYGRSAGPLARRHGATVAPFAASPLTALAAGAVLAGHPVAGAAVAAGHAATVAARAPQLPRRAMWRLAAQGQLHAAASAAEALRRAWWPVAVVAALRWRRCRPALAAAWLVPPLAAWAGRPSGLDPVRATALHVADDTAYGAGVWWGVLASRGWWALVPDLRRRGRRVTPG